MSDLVKHKALALFSGGLDSILAARLILEQGLDVECLHFVSPFFGAPEKTAFWREKYGLKVRCLDIGEDFARLLALRPAHGFGSALNPCVDCKVLMMRSARRIMETEGAVCIISGEVLGQRPMSQRRDTLNIISRDADLKGRLLRPLCALHMSPTLAEEAGIIDRSRLMGLSGRGRKQQLELAARLGVTDFPQPSGGCRLTEQENARSYWAVLKYCPEPGAIDFHLANTGRQLWHVDGVGRAFRLVVGRKKEDNERLENLAGARDLLFKIRDFPGPLALGRFTGAPWPADIVQSAASFAASYCPRALRHAQGSGEAIAVRVHPASLDAPGDCIKVDPKRSPQPDWTEYFWPDASSEIRSL